MTSWTPRRLRRTTAGQAQRPPTSPRPRGRSQGEEKRAAARRRAPRLRKRGPQRELPLAPHVEKPRFVGKRNGQAGQEQRTHFGQGIYRRVRAAPGPRPDGTDEVERADPDRRRHPHAQQNTRRKGRKERGAR